MDLQLGVIMQIYRLRHTHTEIHLLGSVSVTKNSSDYSDIIFFFINKHLMLGG